MSSIAATSAAEKASTSRSTSTARCLAGRYCRLATSASRRSPRLATIAAGSSAGRLAGPGATIESGIGCNQEISAPAGTAAAAGSVDGEPGPEGSILRLCLTSAVRQALVAI